jgi:hypothetical protein
MKVVYCFKSNITTSPRCHEGFYLKVLSKSKSHTKLESELGEDGERQGESAKR